MVQIAVAAMLATVLAVLVSFNVIVWVFCRRTIAGALVPNGPPGVAYLKAQQQRKHAVKSSVVTGTVPRPKTE